MPHFCSSNFPDEEYLKGLVEAQKQHIENYQTPIELLVMWSGAALNWIGDAFTDPHTVWSKENLVVHELTLTGTNPEWNEVIIKRAEKSPVKLKQLMSEDDTVAKMFATAEWHEAPILVRADEAGKLKIFDGMHRVVAAIRDGREEVTAWVARRNTTVPFKPACEPHVIYDFLRAYQLGSNKDRQGLIAALKFLKQAYGNVEHLLKERFGPAWIPDNELQEIIAEALAE